MQIAVIGAGDATSEEYAAALATGTPLAAVV
jgi:hypothetical protein